MDLDDFYDSYEIIYNPNTDLTDSFSPRQMYQMLYEPFEEGCPVQLRTLTDRQIEQVPIMRQILHLMTMLSRSELILSKAACLSSLILIPTSFFWSAGTLRKSAISALISPFLLRYFSRSCSISSALEAVNPFTSFRS